MRFLLLSLFPFTQILHHEFCLSSFQADKGWRQTDKQKEKTNQVHIYSMNTLSSRLSIHSNRNYMAINQSIFFVLPFPLSNSDGFIQQTTLPCTPPDGSPAQFHHPSSSAPVVPAQPQTVDPAPFSSPTHAQGQKAFCHRLQDPRLWPEQSFHSDSSLQPRDLNKPIIKTILDFLNAGQFCTTSRKILMTRADFSFRFILVNQLQK